jgi:hypothetical protein
MKYLLIVLCGTLSMLSADKLSGSSKPMGLVEKYSLCDDFEVWHQLGRNTNKGVSAIFTPDSIWNEYEANRAYIGFPDELAIQTSVVSYKDFWGDGENSGGVKPVLYLTVKFAVKAGLNEDCRNVKNPKILTEIVLVKRMKLSFAKSGGDDYSINLSTKFPLREYLKKHNIVLADDETEKKYHANHFMITSILEDATGKRKCISEYIRPVCLLFNYEGGI